MIANNQLAAYPELVQTLLRNRGIETRDDADKFLHPSYERDIHDPFLMKDMEKAVVRIWEAVEAKQKIVIYGDYDCDGIPGATILHDFFKKIGYSNFDVYIPDRHEEGYGLNMEAIEQFSENDVKLVITVDLGTTDVNEVAQAGSFGIDVIVTDHHLPHRREDAMAGTSPEILPRAFAVLNPKQHDDAYPYDMLCGAGIAWKLVCALVKKYGEYWKIAAGWEKWLLDMAGIGTLADMVPLRDENRAIAHYGLTVLRKNRRMGLAKLFAKAKVDANNLVEEDVTFTIAPRLNAASRMDSPRRAFELLAATDDGEAGALAGHLASLNDTRKLLVANIMKEAKTKLEKREEKTVIVIGNPAWRIGILGLVAGKIADEYRKPTFVWGLEGGEVIKGSCRSDGSVNLVNLMTLAGEGTFVDFGGHKLAGGFSVAHDAVHFLEEKLSMAYETMPKEEAVVDKSIAYETELPLDAVTAKTHALVEEFAPFGEGNPRPVFLFRGAEIVAVKTFGKTADHLEIAFAKPSGGTVKAISFFSAPASFPVQIVPGARVDLYATIEKSTFLRKTEIRLRITGIR